MDLVVTCMRNKRFIMFIWIFACILFLVLFSNFIIYNIFLPEPAIIQYVPSPDGEHIAYIYESDGGATTGFIYHLSIMKKDEKLTKGKGNTYSSSFEFQVEWINNAELQVNNPSPIKIYKQKENVNGIKVQYKFLKE